MKRTLLKICLAVLSLIAMSGSVFAIVENSEMKSASKKPLDENNASVWIQREEVLKEKTFFLHDSDEEEIVLTYKMSRNVQENVNENLVKNDDLQNTEQVVDIYLSTRGEEYRFLGDGTFVGYYNAAAIIIEKDDTKKYINAQKAVSIAQNEIRHLYGDKVIDFELYLCQDRDDGGYQLCFTKFYGENKFVISDVLSVLVNEYGDVIYCLGGLTSELSSFDDHLLEGVTQERLNMWLAKHLEKTYSDSLKDYKIQSIALMYQEGQYILAISVACDFNGYSMAEIFHYKLI